MADYTKAKREAINNGRDRETKQTRWFAVLRIRTGFVVKVAFGMNHEKGVRINKQ